MIYLVVYMHAQETGTKTDQYFQEHGKINRSLGPHRRFQLATVYLLDGRGHHRVPISSTLKVLITPPYHTDPPGQFRGHHRVQRPQISLVAYQYYIII